jgi:hypothetical protein
MLERPLRALPWALCVSPRQTVPQSASWVPLMQTLLRHRTVKAGLGLLHASSSVASFFALATHKDTPGAADRERHCMTLN